MDTSKEPINRFLNRPDVEEMNKRLPKDYLTIARRQYQTLHSYLRKLKQKYPNKEKMLERKKKPGIKKAESSTDFTKDSEISALYSVLKMADSKEEEWNEFYYLLNARYFLKEADGHGAKGSDINPTHQNIEGCPPSQSYTPGMPIASGMSKNISDPQHTYHGCPAEPGKEKPEQPTKTEKSEIKQTNKTGQSEKQRTDLQKNNRHLPTNQSTHTEMTPHTTKADGHGAKASPTSSYRQPMGAVLGSDNNPTHQNIEARHPSQSYTHGMEIASGMSKDISDHRKTCHGFSVVPGKQKSDQPTKTGKSEVQQMNKTGKSEKQRTDSTSRDPINTASDVEMPISLLLSRHIESEKAKMEYQRLLENQKAIFKDRQIVSTNKKWGTSTDIEDITEEQKGKSPILYDYLKNAFEKIKDASQDLVKRALYEFIILTSASDRNGMEATAAAPNNPKKDVRSASVSDVNKLSQSECANLKPIQKALKKLKMTCNEKMSDLNDAERQYYQLIKRDGNFKRRFPDEHRELQVFMTVEECAMIHVESCEALYSALRRLQVIDPLYREAWKEFFFLITSEQQFIIAESCGNLTKTVYNKHSDSMVIPRKSYAELQNELVEKIKQIDELTSRLSKFASQQLTAGNPNIADLSDKHRPTKIGEFYSELYDNEWSEAFEVIKPLEYPNVTEDPDTEYFEEVLQILKNILMAAYEFSAERTETHLKDIKSTLLGTITDRKIDEAKGTEEYDRFVTEHAMKYRKEAAAYAIKTASKVFKQDGFQRFLKQKSDDPKLLAYVDKCVELTWYMRIQDPPMHLHCLQEKETISKTEFAFHGRKGKTTLVCVWPALLLFEGGHLVTKGHVLPEE